eukprot:11388744-Heterocapsa_arctica.AAC.1
MAAMRRLGAAKKPVGGHTCQLPAAAGGADVCGALLDEEMSHPALCGSGPTRMRGHRAIAATLRAA